MVVCVAGLFATGTGFCAGCVPGSGITVADVARGAAATEAGGVGAVPGSATTEPLLVFWDCGAIAGCALRGAAGAPSL
ncbi:MAG: hypothetical protein ACJ78Z_18150, partial [Myxococcales bacterium]